MQDNRTNPEDEVQAVWSIRETSIPAYFIVSGLLFILFNGLFVWRGWANAPPGTAAADIIMGGLKDASGMVPWIVLATILMVEGRYMLVERYLKARYFRGVADNNQAWLGWLERKAAAEREGRPFNEPSPAERQVKNGK